MNNSLSIKNTAVLIMDYQAGILNNYPVAKTSVISRAKEVLKAAREKNMMIIYIVIGFRPGLPELSSHNKLLGPMRQPTSWLYDPAMLEVDPEVKPQDGDIVVTKHRVGPFSGTDLEMILRANDIDTLVLMGVATSGVVLSTLRYAADLDYVVTVLKDCCADRDDEVHTCLTEKIFPRQADVLTSEEFIKLL